MEPGKVIATEHQSTPTPMQLLATATEKGIDPDQLGKLLELQERWEAGQARKAFANAMKQFQAAVPTIKKTAKADRYTYAPLDEVLKTIRGPLNDADLSVRFNTRADGGTVTAICIVGHIDGHEEVSEFSCPAPDIKGTNAAQQQASANSYAKRYALMNALNLAASGDDDDGYLAGQPVNADQLEELERLIAEAGADMIAFCDHFKVVSIDQLPQAQFGRAIALLTAKKQKKNKAVTE